MARSSRCKVDGSNRKQQQFPSQWQCQTQQSRYIEVNVRKCWISAGQNTIVLMRPVINPEPQLAPISLYPLICLRHDFSRYLLLVLCAYEYVNRHTLDAQQCLCVGRYIPSCASSTHAILVKCYYHVSKSTSTNGICLVPLARAVSYTPRTCQRSHTNLELEA